MSGLIFALLIGLSDPFMLRFGIMVFGHARGASYGTGTVLGGVMVKREG